MEHALRGLKHSAVVSREAAEEVDGGARETDSRSEGYEIAAEVGCWMEVEERGGTEASETLAVTEAVAGHADADADARMGVTDQCISSDSRATKGARHSPVAAEKAAWEEVAPLSKNGSG